MCRFNSLLRLIKVENPAKRKIQLNIIMEEYNTRNCVACGQKILERNQHLDLRERLDDMWHLKNMARELKVLLLKVKIS